MEQYLKCKKCGKEFTHWNKCKSYCPECSENRKKHIKPLTFAEISHIGNVYYKIHHKLLSYGEIVALMRLNPKKCICCGAYTGSKYKPICDKCNEEVILKNA